MTVKIMITHSHNDISITDMKQGDLKTVCLSIVDAMKKDYILRCLIIQSAVQFMRDPLETESIYQYSIENFQ